MVNKSDLSNQITGLRSKVKQAIVHMAHHHTREIKKWEVRKGPKAQKFQNKAENFRKEVTILKKINADNVSRYALLMDFKDREKLLADVALPVETKVIIKLATQKPVVSQIEDFRASHPEWKSKVPHLLETLGIRAKFKKKIQKQQDKQARKLARRQEMSKTSKSPSSEESSEDDGSKPILLAEREKSKATTKLSLLHAKPRIDESANSDSEVESESNEEADGDDNSIDEDNSSMEDDLISSDNSSPCINENMSSDGSEDAEVHVKRKVLENTKNSVVSEQNRKSIPRISSRSKLAEVRRFADLQKEVKDNDRKPKDSSDFENDELQKNELSETEPVEEDTFFMTGENKFLKTVAVKRENGEGLNSLSKIPDGSSAENSSQWAIDGRNLKGNRAQRRAKFLGKNGQKPQVKDKRKIKDFKSSSEYSNKGFTKQSNGAKNYSSRASGGLKLSSKKPDNFSNEIGTEKSSGSKKKVSNSVQLDSGESLHPSWEAKRKQKVSLENFQGKKIKFDD